METTGHRGLDELLVNCTQLAIDDYKNYIANYNKIADSAKVEVYRLQSKIKRKMKQIEDFLGDGLFCALDGETGDKAIKAIQDQMNFSGGDIVSEEEYNAAVENIRGIENAREIFLTISEAKKRANIAAKTARLSTTKKLIEKLKKLQKDGYTLKGAIKALEKGGEND